MTACFQVMPSQVSILDLLMIIVDVGKGCAYLEELHHVHRDLAARNCLISSRNPDQRVVKIGMIQSRMLQRVVRFPIVLPLPRATRGHKSF